jgi:hypothetical protein
LGVVVTMDSIRSQLAAHEYTHLHLWHVPHLDSRPLREPARRRLTGRRTAAG